MKEQSSARDQLERIYRAAVAAVDPAKLVHRAIDDADIAALVAGSSRVYLLAVGKAASSMTSAIATRLGDKLEAATVVALPGSHPTLPDDRRIRIYESSHPLPSSASENGAKAALAMLANARADNLVIVALSGGASAMFAMPPDRVLLTDKIALTQSLLRTGASIRELNAVRKHLSLIKGGQLLRAMNGARVLGLILSDVPDSDLATIGSGLTAPDPSTYSEVISILKRRQVWGRAPESIRDHLERGNAGEIAETPKAGDPIFARVTNVVIGDNATALEAAEATAREFGYTVDRWRELRGEANDLGRSLASHLCAMKTERVCVIAGGEPVVTVRGSGKGGRAQQSALAMASEMSRIATSKKIAALFAGTDGVDGPTDAAGAFVSTDSTMRASALGLDAEAFLNRNDAYTFFDKIGDLFKPGATGSNVADIFIGLIGY